MLNGLAVALLFLCSQDRERELTETVRRLDSSEPEEREAAQADLDRISPTLGSAARDLLKRQALTAGAEAKARLAEQIAFLAQLEECRGLVGALDRIPMPSVEGRPFVQYTTGREQSYLPTRLPVPEMRVGWILRESEEEISLFEVDLGFGLQRRTRLSPEDRERFRRDYPHLRTAAGEYEVLDFRTFCGEILSGKRPLTGLPQGAQAALYASWALKSGDPRLAVRFMALPKGAPGSQALGVHLSRHLQIQAIRRAQEGAPLVELHHRWSLLTAFPDSPGCDRPGELVRHYEALLRPALSAPQGADAWIERLHESAGEYVISVSGGYTARDTLLDSGPARELLRLGWEAIPALIRSLEDSRPSRASTYQLSLTTHGESRRLLRYGDLCRRVLWELTGLEAAGSSELPWVKDPEEERRTLTQSARVWWEKTGTRGLADHFLDMLEKGDEFTQPIAARGLLKIDREKYLPRLLGHIGKPTSPWRCYVLHEIGPSLGKEHEKILESLLSDAFDYYVIRVAAKLWDRCGSQAGVREVVNRLFRRKPDDEFPLPAALEFLCTTPADSAMEAVLKILEDEDSDAKEVALHAAGAAADPRIAARLVALLEDARPTREDRISEHGCRFSDLAAHALTAMLGRPVPFRLFGPEEERDARIGKLKAWWAAQRESIDWAALRKAHRDQRASIR